MKNNILGILMQKYNKTTLTKKEVAEELGLSLRTIDNMVKNAVVLPKPLKIGGSKNAPVRFNIVDISEFITDAMKINNTCDTEVKL